MFGWLFKIVGGKANAASTDNRFDEVLEELRQQRNDLKAHETEDRNMHKDVLAEIRETNRHLSMTNATLSNLVGRFEATNSHQRQ
jgi:uncharacterized membrane-anchored protein YhcB (DUF1043 family)